MRIVFMGTPDFAVESLAILQKNKYNIVGVITVPDKPSGRGLQLQPSPVKKYAEENKLPILQPTNLKDENFILELKSLKADLQIVVAFRMLPEVVWKMPPLGTINLHGSLLPQYRGAAPINWAIINGEKETGVSTFFLQHAIDTGKIIFREKIIINENDTAGVIHDRLMHLGAELILRTVKAVEDEKYPQIDQNQFIDNLEELKTAPKIFKVDCEIDWQASLDKIHNFVRGLSPYPAAHSELISPEGKKVGVKIFFSEKEYASHNTQTASIVTDSKTFIKVAVKGGYLIIKELQLAGKKRMNSMDFLRGFPLNKEWKMNSSKLNL